MDVNFGLRDMGVCFNQGTLFPENLIMEIEVKERINGAGGKRKELKVLDRGFIYEG